MKHNNFTSPLPIEGEPVDCVELIIYDNDGPEGFFQRMRFERSASAIKFIIDNFLMNELDHYNFTLTNHWKSRQ